MDRRPKITPANLRLNAKSKSTLNTTARLTASPNPENSAKPKSVLEQQLSRNFRFSMSPNQIFKKEYKKNSDKMIKPPEKHGKPMNNSIDEGGSTISNSADKRIKIRRGASLIPNRTRGMSVSARSLTQNFDENVLKTFVRVDTKTIFEIEQRLESLQSVLLRKVDILKNRQPEKLKKEYKFIALVTDDESKLVVKESDAKRFPDFLPAKSIEDLNRKAGEFFIACLLSFVDKLRSYQKKGRSIDCDEIYDELKKEEKDYSCIFQDWVNDLHANAHSTEEQLENSKIEVRCHEIQTDIGEKRSHEIQTDAITDDKTVQSSKMTLLTTKMEKLRLEKLELKDQLREQSESYTKKIKAIEDSNKEKFTELFDSVEQEKCEKTKRENAFKTEQKLNSDLSLQIMDLKDELSEITKKYEESLNKQEETVGSYSQLEKYCKEVEELRTENRELQDLNTNLLKKLDKRYVQYELMEKEIKLQKRMVRAKTEEIEQLKIQFENKIKENRQLKDSLEARNKLIDHLRNAVEIDQKKIREYEIQFDLKRKLARNVEHEIKLGNEKLKRFKTSGTVKRKENIRDLFVPNEQNQFSKTDFSPGTSQSSADQKTNAYQKPKERCKKINLKSRDDDIEPLIETTFTTTSTEAEKTPTRNLTPLKRSRNIVVKKYDL